jgi:hypothetical protein
MPNTPVLVEKGMMARYTCLTVAVVIADDKTPVERAVGATGCSSG